MDINKDIINAIKPEMVKFYTKIRENESMFKVMCDGAQEYGAYYFQQNQTSVKDYGLRSAKYYFPQLKDVTTTACLCRRILGARAEPKRGVQIIAPRISTSVNIGSTVKVNKHSKIIHSEDFVVKSLVFRIPQFTTLITAGDFNYGFLDELQKISAKGNALDQERLGTSS